MAPAAHSAGRLSAPHSLSSGLRAAAPLSSRRAAPLTRSKFPGPATWQRYRPCSLSMNGCGAGGGGSDDPVGTRETRTLPAVAAPESAVTQLKLAVSALSAEPPRSSSGIIRLEVPIRQRADAIDWLHAQHHLPRCYFSGRGQMMTEPSPFSGSNGGVNGAARDQALVSVAGVGSAVFFQRYDPFAVEDWRRIKRFLSKDCPLIRAYGAIRFDAKSVVSSEWKEFGSFYFIIPQRD